MSLTTLTQNLDEWCGPPSGHPPRPPWLRDILTAVVLAELSYNVARDAADGGGDSLYEAARDLYQAAADKVALNPQPLPPLTERPT